MLWVPLLRVSSEVCLTGKLLNHNIPMPMYWGVPCCLSSDDSDSISFKQVQSNIAFTLWDKPEKPTWPYPAGESSLGTSSLSWNHADWEFDNCRHLQSDAITIQACYGNGCNDYATDIVNNPLKSHDAGGHGRAGQANDRCQAWQGHSQGAIVSATALVTREILTFDANAFRKLTVQGSRNNTRIMIMCVNPIRCLRIGGWSGVPSHSRNRNRNNMWDIQLVTRALPSFDEESNNERGYAPSDHGKGILPNPREPNNHWLHQWISLEIIHS